MGTASRAASRAATRVPSKLNDQNDLMGSDPHATSLMYIGHSWRKHQPNLESYLYSLVEEGPLFLAVFL